MEFPASVRGFFEGQGQVPRGHENSRASPIVPTARSPLASATMCLSIWKKTNGSSSRRGPRATRISLRSLRESTASRSCSRPAARASGSSKLRWSSIPTTAKRSASSGIALSNQLNAVQGLGGAVAADLLSDRTPLIVKDIGDHSVGQQPFQENRQGRSVRAGLRSASRRSQSAGSSTSRSTS